MANVTTLSTANTPAPVVTQDALTALGGGEAHQYLTFTLGGELFAVGILNVKEIIEYATLTQVPMMKKL